MNGDVPHLDYYCFDDVASSLVNNTKSVVRVFQDYDYKNTAVTLFPGEALDLNGSSFNDQASSVQFFTAVATGDQS
ncbi:peptidase inhibitor family I36 protein [Kitasatospora sp. MAA4]|uniref:peptidase inhibitor family I36 protein n=1 Tax=Kitasatospora sp. MAA4 TaxID=3035093 RepID=UPI0024755AD7|nr:peptidase inhibitor family I36 protein [Kitasatospora sp. MAA4]